MSIGIYPDAFKKAEIRPIHKKESKEICNNYRPTSLLPTFAKLFEICLHTRLYILVKNNILKFKSI